MSDLNIAVEYNAIRVVRELKVHPALVYFDQFEEKCVRVCVASFKVKRVKFMTIGIWCARI